MPHRAIRGPLRVTRTSADVRDTTASPPEADMTGSPRDVAKGPMSGPLATRPFAGGGRPRPLWRPRQVTVAARAMASSSGSRPKRGENPVPRRFISAKSWNSARYSLFPWVALGAFGA